MTAPRDFVPGTSHRGTFCLVGVRLMEVGGTFHEDIVEQLLAKWQELFTLTVLLHRNSIAGLQMLMFVPLVLLDDETARLRCEAFYERQRCLYPDRRIDIRHYTPEQLGSLSFFMQLFNHDLTAHHTGLHLGPRQPYILDRYSCVYVSPACLPPIFNELEMRHIREECRKLRVYQVHMMDPRAVWTGEGSVGSRRFCTEVTEMKDDVRRARLKAEGKLVEGPYDYEQGKRRRPLRKRVLRISAPALAALREHYRECGELPMRVKLQQGMEDLIEYLKDPQTYRFSSDGGWRPMDDSFQLAAMPLTWTFMLANGLLRMFNHKADRRELARANREAVAAGRRPAGNATADKTGMPVADSKAEHCAPVKANSEAVAAGRCPAGDAAADTIGMSVADKSGPDDSGS